MSINSIAFATKLTDELDQALAHRSATGILADDSFAAKFVGAKTVRMPYMSMQGLGNYDRDNGFVRGGVNVSYDTYTLMMDRGRTFQIDAEEADESGMSDLIGKVAGEFLRTQVIPEMDAYVLSTLAKHAIGEETKITGTPESHSYKMLLEAIHKAQNAAGFDEELVAFVSSDFWECLQMTPELQRTVVVNEVTRGDISTRVNTINGVPIIPVMNNRMKTEFIFRDGVSTSETSGGFYPATDAKNVSFIVMPKRAVSLVKKTEKARIFSPAENQNADAWKMDYRVYYDVFVKLPYAKTVYVHVAS